MASKVPKVPKVLHDALAAWGKRGGKARMSKTTAEERKAFATAGGKARQAKARAEREAAAEAEPTA